MILNFKATATLLIAAATMAMVPATAQNYVNKAHTFVGKAAPTFVGTTTEGAKLSSADNLKGKVLLLDFWATWCGPCKEASPTMQKLHKDYWAKGLRVIGVSGGEGFEEDKSAKPIAAYKKEHKYTYPFVYNNEKSFKDYTITGVPQFILIGKDGKVKKTWEGFTKDKTPADIEAAVKAAL